MELVLFFMILTGLIYIVQNIVLIYNVSQSLVSLVVLKTFMPSTTFFFYFIMTFFV